MAHPASAVAGSSDESVSVEFDLQPGVAGLGHVVAQAALADDDFRVVRVVAEAVGGYEEHPQGERFLPLRNAREHGRELQFLRSQYGHVGKFLSGFRHTSTIERLQQIGRSGR